ncbi:MAG: hypothetical protein H6915_05310 [Novosphingobium sp.]|nr:hypothetical protein [Novosphingobium sp.]
MTGGFLREEMWRAAEAVRAVHIERITALGVSLRAIAELGMDQHQFGVAPVRWLSGGMYEPDPDGEPAVIMPVMHWSVIEPFEGVLVEVPEIIDLIAWTTSDPTRWSWRIGTGWALGEALMDEALPVRVVLRPLDWLAMSGNATCVLDWAAPLPCWAKLRSAPSLQFSDDALRQRVRNALVRSVALPTMEIADAT